MIYAVPKYYSIRVFEADFSYTSDGELVLWHDWDTERIHSAPDPG